MRAMKNQYGAEKGERVFYATANKRKQKPESRASVEALRKSLK
jgi:hypothetical protein